MCLPLTLLSQLSFLSAQRPLYPVYPTPSGARSTLRRRRRLGIIRFTHDPPLHVLGMAANNASVLQAEIPTFGRVSRRGRVPIPLGLLIHPAVDTTMLSMRPRWRDTMCSAEQTGGGASVRAENVPFISRILSYILLL
ncbi:hypothetical protein C8J57DRAFT_1484387 [Mycena rebaudengoi]|nr:hypothetical protein C8J57DRAFT_1484387 [Mycena rebaudengoi]